MLSGLILAGGRSSRMGRDKAMLKLPDGRTLLQRQADVLREAGAKTILISIKPGTETGVPNAIPVHDAIADAGPLAGIAAGLRVAPAGMVLVLAVDMPGIEAAHWRQLVASAANGQGVVPALAGQIEPLVGMYPAALADSAERALKAGRLAVHAWVREEVTAGNLRLWEAPADWAGALRSWNTAADLPPGR